MSILTQDPDGNAGQPKSGANPLGRRAIVGKSRRAVGYGPWTGVAMALPFVGLVASFVVYPFIQLTMTAMSEPNGISNFSAFFDSSLNVRVMRTTFIDSLLVTLIVTLVGGYMAWTMRTTRSRTVKGLLSAAVFVPFLLGSVVKLYAFTVLLERLGFVNRVLMRAGLIDEPLDLLYNQFAVVIGMAYQMLPFAVLPLYVTFKTIDLNLIKAAESLGARRWRALVTIVGPLATPGLLATGIIVFVISIGFYLTPIILGGAGSPFTSALISQHIFVYYDLPAAAVSALLLLLGGLSVIGVGVATVGAERLRRAVG